MQIIQQRVAIFAGSVGIRGVVQQQLGEDHCPPVAQTTRTLEKLRYGLW